MHHPATAAVLHEVLQALAHELPREALLSLLAEKARLLTDAESAVVARLADDSRSVVFEAAAGAETDDLVGSQVALADTLVGNTALTGETLLAYQPDAIVCSAAAVALHHQGSSVGALAALNKRGGGPFSGDDLLILTTLSAAGSAHVAMSRLRSDAVRQERELAVLYEAVRGISGHLSLQEVLQAIVDQIRAHIESAAVVVFLSDDEGAYLYVAEDSGLTQGQREVALPADSGLGRAILLRGHPVRFAFVDEDSAPGTLAAGVVVQPSPFPDLPIRSGLASAIRKGETVHGVVLAISQQTDAYGEADSKFLAALASQAAVAIENATLYEAATRRAEEAGTLYDLSQAISSTLSLPDVLARVADAGLSLLSVDAFALFLRPPGDERLELVASRGLPADAAERLQPAIGEGIPGWIARFETPTAVQDVAADHRNAALPLHELGIVSLLGMPLQVSDQTIGVLCAMTTRRRLFTVAEMELGYTVANHAAIAIHNARLYADARRKSLELRKYFHRVARALGAPQAPAETAELVATLAREVTEADRCTLQLLGPRGLTEAASVGFRAEPAAGEGETPAGWVLRRARALAIEDIAEDERFAPDRFDRPARGRVGGYLGVPMRHGETLVGVLEVYTRATRRWRSDEARLLTSFAAQAAIALESARLQPTTLPEAADDPLPDPVPAP